MAKRKIEKGWFDKIKPDFELRIAVMLSENLSQGQRIALRGLDVPEPHSKRGKALRAHVEKVFAETPMMALLRYDLDPKGRYPADIYYMPDEENAHTIVAKGTCLNQELLDLKLADPYDEGRRTIDFAKARFNVEEEVIELKTENFKAEVCMYINDCKQYLSAAIDKKPVDMMKGGFAPTDDEYLIIYALKELKDLCMHVSGRARLDWKGN